MTRNLLATTITLIFCTSIAAPAARAESTDESSPHVDEDEKMNDPNVDAAKSLFDEGTALYERGEYSRAADAFRKANQLNPNWRIHFNIGQCEALAKRHGLALQAFEAYLSKGGDDIALTRQTEVRSEIKRLREMTGALEIAAPDGAKIIIDGVERGVSPLAGHIPVAAGVTHLVQIEESDPAHSESKKVIVVGGKTVSLSFLPKDNVSDHSTAPAAEQITAEDTPPTPSPVHLPPVRPQKTGLHYLAMISLVTSGAVLLAGGVTGLVSMQKYDRLDERCPNKTCTDPSDQTLMTEIDNMALATDILLTTGGVLAITGIVLLAANRGRAQNDKTTLKMYPSFGGVQLEGKF